jgi:hypothetical protein
MTPDNARPNTPVCGANWDPSQIAFEAGGETLRIISERPRVICGLRKLGYAEVDARSSEGQQTVYRIASELESTGRSFFVEHNESIVFRAHDEDWIVHYLVYAIRWFFFQKMDGELHVHAGAVAFQGHGIMLPGESGSGKSTLTLALLLKGCHCLSDDLAVVERKTLRLTPTTKHVSLRRPTYAMFPTLQESLLARACRLQPEGDEKAFLPLEIVGENLLSASCALSLIVFPTFRHDEFCAQLLDRGTAVRKLLRLSFNLRWRTKELIDFAIDTVEKTHCFALTFGDVHQAADWIIRAAERGTRSPCTGVG